jgi:hypothetical protein
MIDLFRAPTVATLARHLAGDAEAGETVSEMADERAGRRREARHRPSRRRADELMEDLAMELEDVG